MHKQSAQEIKTTMRSASPADAHPDQHKIETLAYQLWLERGSPMGSPEIDWQRAEQELRKGTQSIHRAA